MFKECLIDIDFNLLVLNVASVFEISYSAARPHVPQCWGASRGCGAVPTPPCRGSWAATAGDGGRRRVVSQGFTPWFS